MIEMGNVHERRNNVAKELIRQEEVSAGINVIVDNRFVALFPMETKAQVDHLVASINLAVRQKLEEPRS